MDAIKLQAMVANAGIRHINFFNGRLLSGEDLSAEREANHAHARYLGQAVGAGVAYGLEVSRAPSSPQSDVQVEVKAGLAVNQNGQVLQLACNQIVSLVPPAGATMPLDCVFSDCSLLPAGSSLSVDGYYLLTIAPASQREGLAPVSGLGNSPTACNSRYFTEGVQFRLVPMPASAVVPAHARNAVAYQCFGVKDPALQIFLNSPFDAELSGYGLLDGIDPARLTTSDVPLALIAFTVAEQIQFVDIWSVRRRIGRSAEDLQWRPLVGDRRLAEAEAAFFQFQDQIAGLLIPNDDLSAFVADDQFAFLPAAGLLPIGSKRFDPAQFFKNLPVEQISGDSAFLRQRLHESFYVEPIELAAKPPVLLYSFPDRSEFVLFLRADRATPVDVSPPPPPPPAAEDPKTGEIIVEVAGKDGKAITPKAIAEVWAETDDVPGVRYEGVLVDYRSGIETKYAGSRFTVKEARKALLKAEAKTEVGAVKKTLNPRNGIFFVIDSLPTGEYRVKVSAAGYFVATSDGAITLAASQRKRTVVLLSPMLIHGKETAGVITHDDGVRDKRGNQYTKFKVIDEVYRKKPSWDPGYIDPSPELNEKLTGHLRDLLNEQPDLPMTTSVAGITVRPDYSPDVVSDAPYAYLATSDGAYLPLLMVPSDLALPASTPVSAGQVPDLSTEEAAARLRENGLNHLDVLASGYGQLLSDIVGTANSASSIADARAGVVTARNSFGYYSGVGTEAAAKLTAGKFDDVALANASASELNKLDAKLFPTGFAQRLIDQARAFVPESAWSLEKSNLGLNDSQIETLHDSGVSTVGGLTATSDESLPGKLGMSAENFSAMKNAADLGLASGRVALAPEPRLTSLDRVNDSLAIKLVAAGIDSASKLADSDAKSLALKTGISEADATAMIKTASVAILSRRAGMTTHDANAAVSAAESHTLNASLTGAAASESLDRGIRNNVIALRNRLLMTNR